MGRMCHHTIVVSACMEPEEFEPVHIEAIRLFGNLVSPVINCASNGYLSFFIAPDGSKEGWERSLEMDHARVQYIEYLHSMRQVRWIYASFADEQGEPQILGSD